MTAVPRRDPRHAATMSIGEVLSQLQPDFPDVTHSKLRFLESEGIVEPARSPSGYRKFSPDDVERLRYAMLLQRDRYWPLRRIREHLDAIERGAEEPVGGAAGPRPVGTQVDGAESSLGRRGPVRLTREELLASSGLTAEQAEQLEGSGLLVRRSGGWYDDAGLAVAATVAELAAYGIEPRHLRAFRTAADREVGLVEQVVAPLLRQRGPDARARAEESARDIAGLLVRLHAGLLETGIRDRSG